MTKSEKINGWTFEETIKTTENLMESEQNMFKWDVLLHLRDFAESFREELGQYRSLGTPEELQDMKNNYFEALSDWRQYRKIGTLEECRAWKEKRNAKKVISFDYDNGTVNYGCPVCKRKIISKINGEWCGGTFNEYCDRCGQRLDWSNEV